MCKVPALLVLLSLCLYPYALRAQTTNASITGRVTDPSKATIADAKVVAAKRWLLNTQNCNVSAIWIERRPPIWYSRLRPPLWPLPT